MMAWSQEQIEQWRRLHRAYLEDTGSVKRNKDIDQRRLSEQHDMMQWLHAFLDGTIPLKQFNTIFQQKTHKAWNAFHLQGMSGGLFLNKLVKYVPNEDTFAHLLRLMICVPEETQDGRRQMQAFIRFIEALITSDQITRVQLQPGRVPFFLSAWWHIQDPERWPIYYLDVRQALLAEEMRSTEASDPVERYFVFRTRFLALAQILGISSWELEHVATWYARRKPEASSIGKAHGSADANNDNQRVSPQKQACILANRAEVKDKHGAAARDQASSTQMKERMVSCRTHLQWLLAKLGHKVGCRVWIAASDHSKVCQHERLGNLSLPSLPVFADPTCQQILRQIDVLWLLEDEVIAAYEIEQAHTDVSISLLRLYDLGALFLTHQVHLCVVAPQDRFEKVRCALSRPTFRGHELRKHCALISEEVLLQQEAHILRWASSPAVIEELIGSVSHGVQQ
jgi:hypothetical protein